MEIKNKCLVSLSFGYLLLPFLIFCVGFLKPIFSIPIASIFLFFFYRQYKEYSNETKTTISLKEIVVFVVLLLVWVSLSGIGGFMFQNFDFHGRNAIFRDLVNNSWPVYYSEISSQEIMDGLSSSYTLVYYLGFWLPSALFGKIFGWGGANIALFFWTCFGIILTAFLIKSFLKRSLVLIIFLMIFFSGMDILGITLKSFYNLNYINLFPPITHLEWWAEKFQFSSMTTQLFWVFNQAIPTWVCLSLFLKFRKKNQIWLIWSLCFFYAPIPSLGFIPVVLFDKIYDQIANKVRTDRARDFSLLSGIIGKFSLGLLESISISGIILIISIIYFSINNNSLSIRFLSFESIDIVIYLAFFIPSEWFILWLLVLKQEKPNRPQLYLIFSLLFFSPIILIGKAYDFGMRASIPPLFFLMIESGKKIFYRREPISIMITLIFIFGSVTPFFEICRSIYRTVDYYQNIEAYEKIPRILPEEAINIPFRVENDHPFTLLADDYISLENYPLEKAENYIGNVDNQFFKVLFK